MRLFLDTSALTKRYVHEPGSEQLLEFCREADEIVLSYICAVELLSALNRRKREGVLTKASYVKIKRMFSEDLKGATVIEFYPSVVAHAVRCLERTATRSLDAIQIASALVSECDLFLSADTRQAAAAEVMGLKSRCVGV